MRGPHAELYVHMVWATWDRLPLVTPSIKAPLIASMLAKCRELGATALAIGVVSDHAHLLVRIPPTLAVATLVKEVKGSSSHLITHAVATSATFKWQGGYGAFTLAARDVPMLRAYIARQEQRHKDGATKPEWEITDVGQREAGD